MFFVRIFAAGVVTLLTLSILRPFLDRMMGPLPLGGMELMALGCIMFLYGSLLSWIFSFRPPR